MKKVLLFAAALSLLAAPALAAITGSAHDLSQANGGYNGVGNVTEICVFCHTPHGADTTIATAPLWNRTTVSPAAGVYNGLDLQGSATDATVAGTDAPLCLSCHDGVTLLDALNNPPNSGGALAQPLNAASNANLSTDLSDDHPIGFNYATVAGADAEIDTLANATSVGKIKFFTGTTADEMWCSSCHDVHDDTNSPFLNADNTDSALCLACHIK